MEKHLEIQEIFKNNSLISGRIISYSKSGYREKHPDNIVVFNANIFTERGKVWWGDLDLTKESEILQKIATESGETLYVLRELDGRFENEKRKFSEVKKLSIMTFVPQKTIFDII